LFDVKGGIKMRKRSLCLAALAAVFLASSFGAAGEKIKIGFSIQDISNPSWSEMWIRMEKKGKELGVELTLSDCQADPAKQITSLENFIQGGYDAIIVHCFDAQSAVSTLQDAAKKGIKIVAYDTFVQPSDCYFGLDNYAVGKQIAKNAAEWMKKIHGDRKVEVGVCNYPLNQVCLDRAEGIVAGLKEFAPNAVIVAQAQAGYTNEGVVVGENFMQAHPNMKVVVGIDDAGLLGVYESVKAAGKLADDFGMFGIDALPETLRLISENAIFRSTIHLDLNTIGEKMVQAAYDLTQGKKVQEKTYFPMVNIDISNVKEFIGK
jgi:ribose transport system substrate-binding protein